MQAAPPARPSLRRSLGTNGKKAHSSQGFYWFPRTRLGKISFWTGVGAFFLIYLQYWVAMLFRTSNFLPGLVSMFFLCVAGVASIVALTKSRDRAILLFVSAVLGCLGLLFVLGEFLFPH